MGDEETPIASTCGVKQGDNLGPTPFVFLTNAVSTSLDKKWIFEKPNFRWHGVKKDQSPKNNPTLSHAAN